MNIFLSLTGTEEVKKYAILNKTDNGDQGDDDDDDDGFDREDRDISFIHDDNEKETEVGCACVRACWVCVCVCLTFRKFGAYLKSQTPSQSDF